MVTTNPRFDPYYTWHRAQQPGNASVAEFVAVLQTCGVELFEARKLDRIRVQSREPLPRDLRRFIRDNKEALLNYLFAPASPEECAAVAATGRNPSPLLTRAQARELALTPAPPQPTRWELLLDGYGPHLLIGKDGLPVKVGIGFLAWEKRRASRRQLNYLRSLAAGIIPPTNASAGAMSYAIDLLKWRQRR
jgi:hypothetical protein